MPTDLVSTLGASATAYSVAAGTTLLLQMRTMIRRGSSGDVSVAFLAATNGGYLVWLLYGLGIGSFPLVVSDAVGLVCGIAALVAAVRLRRPPARDRWAGRAGLDHEAARELMQLRAAGSRRSGSAGARHGPRQALQRRLLDAEQLRA
jgi:uncharacterized protein with PQ loop repeat